MKTLASVADEIMHGPARRRFIVDEFLPTGLTFLYGPTGCGKTGVMVRIAISIAASLEWGGRRVEAGAVLIIAAENRTGLEERLVAAAEAAGLDPATLAIGITEPPHGGLVAGNAAAWIRSEAAALQAATGKSVRLLVVDTLGAAIGDVSHDDARPASVAANHLESVADALRAAALILHHSGKDGRGLRGSQVFADRADAIVRLKTEGGSRLMELEKLRNGAAGARFSYVIESIEIETSGGPIDVQFVPSVVAVYGARPQAAPPTQARQTDRDHVLEVLRNLGGKALYRNLQTDCFAAWADRNSGAKRKAFSTSIEKLESEKKIRTYGNPITVVVTKNSVTPAVTDGDVVTDTVTAPSPKGKGVGNAVTPPPARRFTDDRREARDGTA